MGFSSWSRASARGRTFANFLTISSTLACVTLGPALAQQTARPLNDPALALPAPPVPAPSSTVAGVHGDREDMPIAGRTRTRFVIGLARATEFQVFSLPNPNRVIVELPDVRLQLPQATGAPQGLVTAFRGGLSAPGQSRVVIEVAQPVVVENAEIVTLKDGRGAHLTLDIVPANPVETAALLQAPNAAGATRKGLAASPASALGAANVQPPVPRPAVRPDVRARNAYKPVIVIDPGHGGHDSGAIKHGAVEKDVVLSFSKALRDKLNATGRYKVLMTRDDDTFVELDQRRRFAEEHKAALFIAVHADYANSDARGATIYSLREAVAEDLRRSAKSDVGQKVSLSSREQRAVKEADDDAGVLKNILIDLAQREVEVTKERTNVFTRTVIQSMGGATEMRDNPDRSAAFRVLMTAQVPAVLIELAYVSNAADAKLLKSDVWRAKVSSSITAAIENYFSNQISRLPM